MKVYYYEAYNGYIYYFNKNNNITLINRTDGCWYGRHVVGWIYDASVKECLDEDIISWFIAISLL